MLIPELPRHLSNLGGSEYVGYAIFLFTLTAGISRPFSGKLTDSIGRVPVMIFGSLVCFLCGFLYPMLLTVNGFLWLRLFHGMSTGTKPTATAAYVADITPADRRGEAMGMLALFTATGMSFGPSIGAFFTKNYGINVMFYVTSLFALLSILILGKLQETLAEKQEFSWRLLKLGKDEIFEKMVMLPFVVNLLFSFSYGVVLTLLPIIGEKMGIENKGLFFSIYTLASIAVRLALPKISDQKGRIPVLILAALILVASMVLLIYLDGILSYWISGILFGVAWGFISPTISAWTVDLSLEEKRGKALATMYIALELGIGIGAYFAGKMIFVSNNGQFYAFLFSALFSGLAFVIL